MDVRACFPHWVPVFTILFSLKLASRALPLKIKHTSSSSSSTPTQVPDLAPFCTRITKQEVEQLLVAMCSIPAVLSLRSLGRDPLTVRHRQRGVYVRVGEPRRFRLPGPALMVPRLDDRVRPAPPTTHREDHPGGRCSCLMRAKLGSVRLTAALGPLFPQQACLLQPLRRCLHHQLMVSVVVMVLVEEVGAAIHRQQLTRTHPS